ncbi:hypothetical protein AKJ51_03260 [candidate division MSBL1 archaeon SCGC-AAA382A20]|uniref:50S ribosomal protein L13 n=1 Tax=candidate division MSBL1 archaeon SCGC-AAA382A20 TaxID=1698280 RepID=A0A133VJN9_9EURY|nr:hypothetical protein AKJ51_03260 [candidate division MSBL1 archaeon SCGC-AAA382A20]
MIVDAEGQILGRLASKVAKSLLKGEEVKVVNCDGAIITGDPDKAVEEYLGRKGKGDPHHGPYQPESPEGILRRTVRGMLPMDKSKGENAYKNLKTFPGNPLDEEGETIAKGREDITTNYITLEELSKSIGGE